MNSQALRGRPLSERLLAKTVPGPHPNDCWQWTGNRCRSEGYGVIHVRGRESMLAHRAAFLLFRGEVPEGLLVLHACDNPGCTNPAHLFLGTSQDNALDRDGKGRGGQPKGTDHHRARISEDDVRTIRARYESGETQLALAREYPIGNTAISSIVNRKSWKHVP